MPDAFVLLSKREMFSMACAEALCCGTTIVGFKCSAANTVFKPPNVLGGNRDLQTVYSFIECI